MAEEGNSQVLGAPFFNKTYFVHHMMVVKPLMAPTLFPL